MPLCGKKKTTDEDDPILREKMEYERFKQTVGMLRTVIQAFRTELSKLNPMHEEYVRQLKKFTEPIEAAQRERIMKDAEITSGIKTAFDSSKIMYQDLVMTMDRLQVEMANLDAKLKEREVASIKRNRYMKKVEQMKQRESMTGSPKLERNLKKFAEADAKFDDIDSFTCRELHRFMEQRFSFIEKVVHDHSEQLRVYYKNASGNLGNLMESVVLSTSPIALAAQGPVKPASPLSPASPMSPASPLGPVVAAGSQSSSLIEPESPSMIQSPLAPVVPMTPQTQIAVIVEETPAVKKAAPEVSLTPPKEVSAASSIKLPPATPSPDRN